MSSVRHGWILAMGCALAVGQTAPKDAVLEDARRAARSYAAQLPDFLVRQVTTRAYNVSAVETEWTPIDVVTAEVACVNGKEEYRGYTINGKAAEHPPEVGAWSKGEFSSTLEDLFSPATAAEFVKRGPGRAAGRAAIRYDFTVSQRNSHWKVRATGEASCTPAYKGTVWIDRETHRVLRIERRTLGLPAGIPVRSVMSTLEYGFVSVGGRRYLLPVESVQFACRSVGPNCLRNTIRFEDYRKFTAESDLKFGP